MIKRITGVRVLVYQVRPNQPLQRIPRGNTQRRPSRPIGGEVGQKRTKEYPRTSTVAEKQHGCEGDTSGRPNRRGAGVINGESQAEFGSSEIDCGQDQNISEGLDASQPREQWSYGPQESSPTQV